MYVNNFLLALITMAIFKVLKVFFAKKYDIKDFGKVKTIIRWQIYEDFVAKIIKINQSVFVQDLMIEKNLIDSNANVTSMKTGSSIDMSDQEN